MTRYASVGDIQDIIDRITRERMRRVNLFPGDTMLIEQEIRIAVASGIEEALRSVMQDYPDTDRRADS